MYIFGKALWAGYLLGYGFLGSVLHTLPMREWGQQDWSEETWDAIAKEPTEISRENSLSVFQIEAKSFQGSPLAWTSHWIGCLRRGKRTWTRHFTWSRAIPRQELSCTSLLGRQHSQPQDKALSQPKGASTSFIPYKSKVIQLLIIRTYQSLVSDIFHALMYIWGIF